jgi:hypothetical protein
MTLPGLSERAAADRRKCCAIMATSIEREHIRNGIENRQLVKRGGGCYMMPRRTDHAAQHEVDGSTRVAMQASVIATG